jgi:hypothetical protein
MLPHEGVQITVGVLAEAMVSPGASTNDGVAATAATGEARLASPAARTSVPRMVLIRFMTCPFPPGGRSKRISTPLVTEEGQLPRDYPGVSRVRNPQCVFREPTTVRWSLVSSTAEFDPERFLGDIPDLPLDAQPGDWCTVVVVDGLGEMRWTLVAREVERQTSLFVSRRPTAPLGDALARPAARPLERVAERRGTDGSESPARQAEGGMDRPAAVPALRGR